MAGQLWKYDSICGLYHMENGLDSSGLIPPSDIILSGTATVPGKLDNAQSFDGIDDNGIADNLLTKLSTVTKGTIVGWLFLDSTGPSAPTMVSCSRNADATLTFLTVEADLVLARLIVAVRLGGVLQFLTITPNGSLTSKLDTFMEVIIKHDGTQVTEIILDDVSQVLNRQNTFNEAAWFADVINHPSPADTFRFGANASNGSNGFLLKGKEDEIALFGELWDADDADAFWNNGFGQIISDPSIVTEPTPLFLRQFQHLLPNAKAWRI